MSPKTWSGYTQHWELRIKPRLGHVPVDEITRTDVQAFVDGLTVGPWAKMSTLRLLRSILDVAHQDGRIHRNPALGVSAGRIPERERHRYLTAQEVQTLATACGDQGDVVTILAYTGLRWSELVGLRVKDIDLSARRLYVRRAAPEVEGHIVIGPPKTRAGIRTAPLPQVVVDIFKARITGREPDDPAVTSPNGKLLRSNNWRRHTHWNQVLKKTNLASLTIHELRHTYASLAQVRRRPSLRAEDHGPLNTNHHRQHLQRPLRRRAGPGRNQPRPASRDGDSTTEDRTETGRIKPTTECIIRVYAGRTWWPGPGSNRRPSAFQADAHTD